MTPFLLGLAVLAVMLGIGRLITVLPVPARSTLLPRYGGYGLMGLGVLVSLFGRPQFGIPVITFGMILVRLAARARPVTPLETPGRQSRVATSALAMTLDHDTGIVSGEVLAGPWQGRSLDSLGADEFDALIVALAADAESLALLEAYRDRRTPGWREHAEADLGAGLGGPAGAGMMSLEEAHQVLGLGPGAGEAEIREAHRRLMRAVHPDHGGTTFLAARVNQAKDILLAKHR